MTIFFYSIIALLFLCMIGGFIYTEYCERKRDRELWQKIEEVWQISTPEERAEIKRILHRAYSRPYSPQKTYWEEMDSVDMVLSTVTGTTTFWYIDHLLSKK